MDREKITDLTKISLIQSELTNGLYCWVALFILDDIDPFLELEWEIK